MKFIGKWISVTLAAALVAANLTLPSASITAFASDPITAQTSSSTESTEALNAAQESETDADTQESDSAAAEEETADETETAADVSSDTDAESGSESDTEANNITDESTSDEDSSDEDISDEEISSSDAEENTDSPEENGSAGENADAGDSDAENTDNAANSEDEETNTEEQAADDESTETADESGNQITSPGQTGEISEDAANAAEESSQDPTVITGGPRTGTIIPTEDICEDTDNDDVFAAYVNQELELTGDLAFDTGDLEESLNSSEKAYASTRLTGNNRTIYAYLLKEIKKVAAGELTSTTFTVPSEKLDINMDGYTASDLGVSAIVDLDTIYEDAVNALYDQLDIDVTQIIRTLIVDCPYELYWYDKTIGTPYSGLGYYADDSSGEWKLYFTDYYDYTFNFTVASAYSASGETNTYEMNADIGTAVRTAYENAHSIVDSYSSCSDYEKMAAYKDEICDRVSYNSEAAAGGIDYGDPWQLIWVLDGNDSTRVVCEGYSKAFQYLCDLSTWNDIFKECISVSGSLISSSGSGGHMWNIVALRDGRSYLVDVTNCDDGTIGSDNNRSDLFLVGTGDADSDTVYAQGSVDNGYYFSQLNNLGFAYSDDTRNRFGDEILTLAEGRADQNTTAEGEYTGDHTHIYIDVDEVAATCLSEGHSAGKQCSICEEYDDSVVIYPKTDHTPGEWTVTKEPTYDAEGTETTTCTVCGETLTRTIDKLVSESSITLDAEEAALNPGGTKQLTATVLPENAHDKTVTWTSSDTSVASVDDSGLVTAKGDGTATITAATAHLGLTASCKITVTTPVTGITLDQTELTLVVGNTGSLTASISPENATNKNITWSSSDADVASVASDGSVTANSAGTVTITVTTEDGAYKASCMVTVNNPEIEPVNLADAVADGSASITIESGLTYNGSAQEPAITVTYQDKSLTAGTDYNVSFADNTNAGTATATINGKGDYTGSVQKTFTIAQASISDTTVSGINSKTYTGDALTQTLTVKLDSVTLTENTDYTISYSDNINVGTAKITITGKGNYTGTVTKTFYISESSISAAQVNTLSEMTYTGSALTQETVLTYNSRTLTEGTDYTVSYSNNINAGTATITFTGKGNFTSSKKVPFIIKPASIEEAEVGDISAVTYSGSAQEPAVTVTWGDTLLAADTDYTVAYTDNTDAGTATVTITGTGNYTGTTSGTFTINPASINEAQLSDISAVTYSGSAQEPSVTVTLDDQVLTPDTDYTISYSSNTNAGTASVNVTGKGNYTGTVSKNFTINPASIDDAVVDDISNVTYNGSAQEPEPSVTLGDIELKKDTDYTIAYKDNINAGTATATITGKGNYTGTVTKDFEIDSASIENAVLSEIADVTYNGMCHYPDVSVTLDGKELKEDTDYTITYGNNYTVGTAYAWVHGLENYTGDCKKEFTINPASIEDTVISDIPDQTYDCSALEPSVKVTLGEAELQRGLDYTVQYSDNINVGTAKVKVSGKDNITGEKTVEFNITAASIEDAVISDIPDQSYTGSEVKPAVAVTLGIFELVKDTDYTVSYENNINTGTASVTVTGKGNYTDKIDKTFVITPVSISDAQVSEIPVQAYTGDEVKPEPVVKAGDKTLVKDTDYTLSYDNNTEVGTATAVITGIGNYTGTTSVDFEIKDTIQISDATVAAIADQTYTGSALEPEVEVSYQGSPLVKDTDFEISYENNTEPGTATVTITGKGKYTGSITKSFKITPISIKDAEITGITNRTYNGKAQTQTPVVKLNGVTLTNGTDYTVSYTNNTNAGTATVIITGTGTKYEGTASAAFNIARAAQNFTVKAAASSIDVGKTTRVTASGAKETNKYTFTSSNTKVATVNAAGTVTGKAAGTVTITVKTAATANYNAAAKTVKITVNKVLKKPGNCHFVKWNNAKYTSCQIAWNKVAGADGYQTLLSWTNGTHASTTYTKSNVLYRNCTVHPQHVSQMKVRAYYMQNGQRKFGPWSNVEYITPSPTKLTTKNASSGSNLKMNISWNIIYGCNGYNVFITTNPKGTWYWNQSTPVNAASTKAVITKYRGSKLKKNTRYYVRIVTRRKRNGVFCTVPMPTASTNIGSFIIK